MVAHPVKISIIEQFINKNRINNFEVVSFFRFFLKDSCSSNNLIFLSNSGFLIDHFFSSFSIFLFSKNPLNNIINASPLF